MTVKELYERMVELNAENYEIGNYYYNGYGELHENDFGVEHDLKRVALYFEC